MVCWGKRFISFILYSCTREVVGWIVHKSSILSRYPFPIPHPYPHPIARSYGPPHLQALIT